MNSTKVRNALSFLAACALCLLHVATANEHLTDDCLKCVQVASSGDERNPVCNEGRCGQFQFSEEYWKKAMSEARSTVPKGSMAFRECAEDLECAETVVILYMDKYGKDCNSDGTKTCDEFARTHWDAIPDIRSGAFGSSAYNSRFEKCHKKR